MAESDEDMVWALPFWWLKVMKTWFDHCHSDGWKLWKWFEHFHSDGWKLWKRFEHFHCDGWKLWKHGLSTSILMVESCEDMVWALPFWWPRSGELRTQKLKSHLVRTQSLNVLPFTPGVGQYIAIHATLTARDFSFLLISTLPVHSPAFFPKPLPIFSCVGLQNKIGHPAGCRFPCWVPAAYK